MPDVQVAVVVAIVKTQSKPALIFFEGVVPPDLAASVAGIADVGLKIAVGLQDLWALKYDCLVK